MHFPPKRGGNENPSPPKSADFWNFGGELWGVNFGRLGGKYFRFPPALGGKLGRCFPPKVGGKRFWGGNGNFWGVNPKFSVSPPKFGEIRVVSPPKFWGDGHFPPKVGGKHFDLIFVSPPKSEDSEMLGGKHIHVRTVWGEIFSLGGNFSNRFPPKLGGEMHTMFRARNERWIVNIIRSWIRSSKPLTLILPFIVLKKR